MFRSPRIYLSDPPLCREGETREGRAGSGGEFEHSARQSDIISATGLLPGGDGNVDVDVNIHTHTELLHPYV